MMIKYRVHEVAKDLNVPNKDVLDALQKYCGETKKHMTALTEQELDVVFESFTQSHEAKSFDDYFAAANEPKVTVTQEAEPAAQPVQQPAQTAQPAPQPAAQPAAQQKTAAAAVSDRRPSNTARPQNGDRPQNGQRGDRQNGRDRNRGDRQNDRRQKDRKSVV